MEIVTQLAVFLENKPGTLARMCDAIAQEKINILALSISDTVDHAVIRMVVDEPRKALLLLEEHNVLVIESDVLMVEADNKAGSLSRLATKLAEANLNIEYAYMSTPAEGNKGIMILRPTNVQKAFEALGA